MLLGVEYQIVKNGFEILFAFFFFTLVVNQNEDSKPEAETSEDKAQDGGTAMETEGQSEPTEEVQAEVKTDTPSPPKEEGQTDAKEEVQAEVKSPATEGPAVCEENQEISDTDKDSNNKVDEKMDSQV